MSSAYCATLAQLLRRMIARLTLLALSLCLGLPTIARAQLTTEELKQLNRLLAEPDGAPSYTKRLRLIGDAIEREADVKGRPSTSYLTSLKQARIPAAEGVPFLVKILDHPAEVCKRTAMRMLGFYGADAISAAPRLRGLMKDDPIAGARDDAMLTLAKIEPNNPATAAAILERLGAAGSSDSTNRAVLQALIPMAAVVPKEAVSRIAKFKDHRWTEVGIHAHELIGKVLALERPTLDQLRQMEAIDWRSTPDEGYAILASIAEVGPKADVAVPLVVELLGSGPPVYLECMALEVLGKFRTGNPRIISALLDRLVAPNPLVKHKARLALQLVDLKEPASVRALAKGLRHGDRMVRFEAAVVLRSWDQMEKLTPPAHAEMLAPLLETLQEVNEQVPPGQLDVYLSLLRHFGTRAAPVADALVRLYQTEGYFQKWSAPPFGPQLRGKLLAVLANVGVPDSARPLVLEALKKGPASEADAGYSYTAAARAVATFAEPGQVVPLLLPALKGKGSEREFYYVDWSGLGLGRPTTARLEAIRALATMGAPAKEALPLLRNIAESEPAPPRSLELVTQEEARRAYNAIAKHAGPVPEPEARQLPFVSGKKDFLHLDERLQVKMDLVLQSPRPQHLLERLQQATRLSFTMDENVDTATPVWASIHLNQMAAWSIMRQLATSPSVLGRWEQVADGYRLVGNKNPEAALGKKPKGTFAPFRDDTNDPVRLDPRLQGKLTIQLNPAKVQDVLKLIQDATGVTFTLENVDTVRPVYESVNWANTSPWLALRSLAQAPRVQGTWEKVGDGYLLRGKHSPPANIVPAAAGELVPGEAPARSRLSLYVVGAFLVILTGMALAVRMRRKGQDATGTGLPP